MRRPPIIGPKPISATAEHWVAARRERVPKADLYTARLTIDITPELRGRIKVAAFQRGITVTNMLRALLENAFASADGGAATRGRRP